MISASKLDLAAKCAWWARPDAPRPPYVPSKYADDGNDVHDEIDTFLRDGVIGESEAFVVWLRDWWPSNPSAYWTPELQIAMNPRTGEVMVGHASRRDRDYRWIPRGWISGTADAINVSERDGERIVHVVDWKTGRADHVEPVARNGQMLFLAAAFAGHFGASSAVVELAFVHLEGVRSETATLDCFALADFVDGLRALDESIPNATPNPGPHCRGKFCASFGTVCPATTGKGRVIADPPAPPFAVALTAEEIESDEHAAWLYQAARQAQHRLSAIWEALRMRAMMAPIPLGEGRVYAISQTTRESVDASVDGAVDVLRRHLGDKAENALKFSTSKAAIRRAASDLKATGAPVKIGELEAKIMEELRAIGAVKVTTSATPEERPAALPATRSA